MKNYKTYIKNSFTKSFPWKLAFIVIGLFYIKRIISVLKSPQTSEDINTRQDEMDSENLNYSVGISKSKAKELSNRLVDAFNYQVGGALFGGTDKGTIEAVFNQLNENNDYRKLYKEFGLKLYNGSGTADENSVLNGLLDKLDLTGWLRSELDFLDFSLNSLIKEKVTNSGLTY
jgi:hypothetical protein